MASSNVLLSSVTKQRLELSPNVIVHSTIIILIHPWNKKLDNRKWNLFVRASSKVPEEKSHTGHVPQSNGKLWPSHGVKLHFPQRRRKTFLQSFTFPSSGLGNTSTFWVIFSKPIAHFKQSMLLHEPHLHLQAQRPHVIKALLSCKHGQCVPIVLLIFLPYSSKSVYLHYKNINDIVNVCNTDQE